MDLHHLNDSKVRGYLVAEIESDRDAGTLYPSKNLNPEGLKKWPALLVKAALDGDTQTLADALRTNGCMLDYTTRQQGGKTIDVKVRHDAPEMLAEGEFNRYYARAVCRRALDDDPSASVEVYRAKAVEVPRSSSEALLGSHVSASVLLDDLRQGSLDAALKVPNGPNSGLSVRLIA